MLELFTSKKALYVVALYTFVAISVLAVYAFVGIAVAAVHTTWSQGGSIAFVLTALISPLVALVILQSCVGSVIERKANPLLVSALMFIYSMLPPACVLLSHWFEHMGWSRLAKYVFDGRYLSLALLPIAVVATLLVLITFLRRGTPDPDDSDPE